MNLNSEGNWVEEITTWFLLANGKFKLRFKVNWRRARPVNQIAAFVYINFKSVLPDTKDKKVDLGMAISFVKMKI